MTKKARLKLKHQMQTYLPIEDHGVIGDTHTAALVGRNGTIDWWCTPSFDAPSVFGSILDIKKGGCFSIAPENSDLMATKQYYIPETNILVTRFIAVHGIAEITDFMAIQTAKKKTTHHGISRGVRVVDGNVTFEMNCSPAFNYARDSHVLKISSKGAVFNSPKLSLGLSSSVPVEEGNGSGADAIFTLNKSDWAYFLLESSKKEELDLTPEPADFFNKALQDTTVYWRNWVQHCQYRGHWNGMVVRSALTLKLLTYAPTGALVAAPTTSLPEEIGGERNWDYRFTWLRDAAWTLSSLLKLGFYEEATAFAEWVIDRFYESKMGEIQPMFTIEGGHEMEEITLDHLEGYRRSGPVRIGNEAYKQHQLDVYGELLDAAYILTTREHISYRGSKSLLRVMDWLSKNWQQPDEGIWEVRGGRKDFLHSRLMCWVAFDRAIKMAERQSIPAPIAEWKSVRDTIYNEIMEKGWNEEKQSFVQHYGGEGIDASALLISLTGFTGGNDSRIVKTIERIEKELMKEPLLYRYNVEKAASDGLKGSEGTFSICGFWLVEALAKAGRLEEARRYLEEMFSYANHLGLYSEEIGGGGEALGNFPQAFTHLALISACELLEDALATSG